MQASGPVHFRESSAPIEPLWEDKDIDILDNIYQLECVSRMNTIYYELRLSRVQLISFWMEGIVAATASGGGLAALLAKNENYIGIVGQYVWPFIALVAAIAAIVRPIYAPGRKIEAFTRQHQGYHSNYFALKKLAFSIRQESKINSEHRKRFETVFDRHVQLSTDAKAADDESAPKDKYRREAEERTKAELPPTSFWWPAKKTTAV